MRKDELCLHIVQDLEAKQNIREEILEESEIKKITLLNAVQRKKIRCTFQIKVISVCDKV